MRLILAAALALALAQPALAAGEPAAKLEVGDRAPEFALRDLGGREVRLSAAVKADVVFLVFWSLRCEACLAEAPVIERIHRAYAGRGATVISVLTDGLDAAATKAAMARAGMSPGYPVLVDPDFAVSDTYTTFVVPHTLVIDRKGIVRYVHTGFEAGAEAQYRAAIDLALRP